MKISSLNNEHKNQNFPPLWASEWGEDAYGLFADLTIITDEKKSNNTIKQRFRYIAAGEFLMGSPRDEPERFDDEDLHKVTITQGYWLADTTVTQALWKAVMGKNPANFTDSENNPVEEVSWNDAVEFIGKISHLNNENGLEKGLVLRLPTEAEWEHACRAGTDTPFSFGDNISSNQVNFNGKNPYNKGKTSKYREKTMMVKSLPINPWGLYEMHGNVWEWCADAWQEKLGELAVVNPYSKGDAKADHVVRGGSWFDFGWYVRSACRDRYSTGYRFDDIGFRLSLGPELQ